MKRLSILLVLCVLLISVTGCMYRQNYRNTARSIRGSWRYKNPDHGLQTLTYKKDMSYELDFEGDGVVDIWGTYHLFNNQIKLTDKAGKIGKECHQMGAYTFSVHKKEVHYDLIADQCPYRIRALDVAWVRYKKKK